MQALLIFLLQFGSVLSQKPGSECSLCYLFPFCLQGSMTLFSSMQEKIHGFLVLIDVYNEEYVQHSLVCKRWDQINAILNSWILFLIFGFILFFFNTHSHTTLPSHQNPHYQESCSWLLIHYPSSIFILCILPFMLEYPF